MAFTAQGLLMGFVGEGCRIFPILLTVAEHLLSMPRLWAFTCHFDLGYLRDRTRVDAESEFCTPASTAPSRPALENPSVLYAVRPPWEDLEDGAIIPFR